MVSVNDTEFNKIYTNTKNEAKHQGTWKDVFSQDMRRYAFIAIIISLFVQFSGINTFIFYSPEIFVHLGYTTINAAFTSGWATCLAELWPVFLAEFLLVNKLGTKKAFLMGAAGMFISMIVSSIFLLELHGSSLGIATIALIFVFLFFFEACYGLALWAFSPEIFPTNIRGRGTSLFMTVDSLAGFIVTGTFPYMLNKIGLAYTIDIYGIITLIAFVFMIFFLPDRKDKHLLEGVESID